MHQQSLSEGVPARRGASWRRGCSRRGLCPPRAAGLWAWLLLAALVVPGAWSFLSEEQEELLVELHNHYRGQVYPSASAMMPLRWDPTLKLVAEGYAAKCVWNHNPDLEDTGENLFAGTGTLDLREALEKWFLEHLDYDFQNNSCDEDKMCGHYTQMVWADTHRVGCAFHLCNDMEGLDWERVSFLVCNYYPAGNYEDERPYVEGDWCSSCPENLQTCENNLCVADSVDEGEEDVDDDDEDLTDEAVAPPPPTTPAPSVPAEAEEEEQEAAPPPTTSDPYVPPASTITPSAPSVTTTSADQSEEQPAAAPPVGTAPPPVGTAPPPVGTAPPPVGTAPPENKSTPLRKQETGGERVERENDVGKKYNKEASSSASTSSPSLLLACLTGILTVRL